MEQYVILRKGVKALFVVSEESLRHINEESKVQGN